jgi:hypothetical protein
LSGRESEYDKEEGGITHTGIPESLLSCAEAVGLGCTDWQPDEIEEKVKHHETQGELEDSRVPVGYRILSSRKERRERHTRGRWFSAMAKNKKHSETAHTTALHLTLSVVMPPGKSTSYTTSRERI